QALPGNYRQRFFRSTIVDEEKGFVVAPEVQQLISFRHLNLMTNWPFTGPFDFIFCRNVMIYFDKPTQQRLVNRFYDILAPGGVLFTGHSESLTGIEHRFHYIQPTIYGKQQMTMTAAPPTIDRSRTQVTVNISDAKVSSDTDVTLVTYSLGSC